MSPLSISFETSATVFFLHVFAFGHNCVCPGIFLFHVLSFDLNGSQNVDADSAAKPLEDLEERGNLYVGMAVLHSGDIGLLRADP